MKNKKILITTLTVFLIISIMAGVKKTNDWFQTHYFIFNQPVNVNVKTPIEVKIRKPQIIEKVIKPATPDEVNTPIKEYACKKFGEFNCLTMIAIFQAESGWDNEAWGYNTNKTLDYGIAQINSVNWKLSGCSLKEIVDEYKNIDCSYLIWDRADGIVGNSKGNFEPWVAYQNSKYLSHLE